MYLCFESFHLCIEWFRSCIRWTSDELKDLDTATIIAQQLQVIQQGRALVKACNDFLEKASTETESFNNAVVNIDDKTKEKIKQVYTDIIKDMKEQIW